MKAIIEKDVFWGGTDSCGRFIHACGDLFRGVLETIFVARFSPRSALTFSWGVRTFSLGNDSSCTRREFYLAA